MRATALASSSPRSLAAPRIQRLDWPLRKRHTVAIISAAAAAAAAAAAPLQLACPLDDDDDCGDGFGAPNLPLLGRRILITAPRSYAASLGGRLLAAGARPLSVPGVRTLRLRPGSREEQELDAALRELLLPLGGGARPSSGGPSAAPAAGAPRRPFAAVAFTSRAGIEAVLERIAAIASPASGGSRAPSRRREDVLAAGGAALAAAAAAAAAAAPSSSSSALSLWALGADAEALALAGVPAALIRTPREASTTGMVAEMARGGERVEGGGGRGRGGIFGFADERILVPVPAVVGGLAEPPVVPRFLSGLRERVGAVPVRVAAYSTAPPADARRGGGRKQGRREGAAGLSSSASSAPSAATVAPSAAAELSLLSAGEIDAVVFSSTAEAQGLAMAAGGVEALLAMMARGNEARKERRRRGEKRGLRGGSGGGGGREGGGGSDGGGLDLGGGDDIVLAAHGPYTAAGASDVLRGARIAVVPGDFSSFAGVVGALEEEFRRRAPPPSR